MSYELEVLKDTPQSLYMLSSNQTDTSGHGQIPVPIGAPEYSSAPLVSGAGKATRHRPGIYLYYPFPYMQPGYERQAFSLETWFFPIAATVVMGAHNGDSDGLCWIGGVLYFSLHFTTTGWVRLAYAPPTARNMHIVGVYNGEKMELWVNGELVDSLELTIAQKADTFAVPPIPNYLITGNADFIQQGIATYHLPLSPMQIRNHYRAGKMAVGNNATSGLFGGVRERVSNDTANLFLDKSYNTKAEWSEGFGEAIIGDSIKSPIDVSGAYVAGTWTAAIPLDHGGTSIDHMTIKIEYLGVGGLETSLDGVTWSAHTNNGRVAGITAGYNPTGKVLRIRVNFIAGSRLEIFSLDVQGYKTLTVTPATRAITLPSGAGLYDEHPILDYNTFSEFYAGNTAVTFGATADSQQYRTISFWYYAFSGTHVVNATPTTFYENNVAKAVQTRVGEWIHVVYVIPAKSTALTITGNIMVMAPVLFENALTAPQIDTLHKSYTGIPKTTVDSANAVTVGTPTVNIYANDWSITGAG